MPDPTALSGTFGRYQVLSRIGAGGMGTVYLALDTKLNRRVALKVPHFSADDDVAIERFHREAQVAASIEHPNICPVFDINDVDGIHYFTMPYIDGLSLAHQIDPEHPWSGARAAALVGKLAVAMAEMHQRGVVHRDLKPGNIMMRKNGEPVLLDFGLARDYTAATKTLINTGLITGTPAYMSPEQYEGDSSRIGPASDIYSLGVILYQLATGQPPYSGHPLTIYGRMLRSPPPPPSRDRPELDEAFDRICLMAMARQPEDRFPTMTEFAAALEHYAADKPKSLSQPIESREVFEQPTTTPTRTKGFRPRSRRLGTWAALLAAVLLTAAVAGVGYWLSGQKPEDGDERGEGERGTSKKGDPVREASLRLQSPRPVTLEPGQKRTITIGFVQKDLDEPIELSVVSGVAGVRLVPGSVRVGRDAVRVELLVEKGAPPGMKNLRLRASAGSVSDTVNLPLTIARGPAFQQFENRLGMTMVWVKPGKFRMGNDERGDDKHEGEKPAHWVDISRPLAVSAHEVTVGQFGAFVAETGHITDAEKDGKGWGYDPESPTKFVQGPQYSWRNAGWKQGDRHPVVNVSWNDAVAFCNWLSKKEKGKYDLPTEAEWEFFARAGGPHRYCCGDDMEKLTTVGNVADASFRQQFPKFASAVKSNDGFVFTAPVGSFQPNAWGLYDIHGNVWEWCKDGRRLYQKQAVKDPVGPADGPRVLRGGSWFDDPENCRCSCRSDKPPAEFDVYIGFRVVLRDVRNPKKLTKLPFWDLTNGGGGRIGFDSREKVITALSTNCVRGSSVLLSRLRVCASPRPRGPWRFSVPRLVPQQRSLHHDPRLATRPAPQVQGHPPQTILSSASPSPPRSAGGPHRSCVVRSHPGHRRRDGRRQPAVGHRPGEQLQRCQQHDQLPVGCEECHPDRGYGSYLEGRHDRRAGEKPAHRDAEHWRRGSALLHFRNRN
ncbi:MAG: SUMF1/EgtB/PvdO family nonheme iron enzyme [Planctomycetes bacterium]|nr:SUMF1/EgtB/PvdO family nonheme iron enzyme [Planctomycetota bacterium]